MHIDLVIMSYKPFMMQNAVSTTMV